MDVRKTVSKLVAVLQCGVGISSVILTPLLHFNVFEMRALLNVTEEDTPLCLVFLLIIGCFSITSSFFLFHDRGG